MNTDSINRSTAPSWDETVGAVASLLFICIAIVGGMFAMGTFSASPSNPTGDTLNINYLRVEIQKLTDGELASIDRSQIVVDESRKMYVSKQAIHVFRIPACAFFEVEIILIFMLRRRVCEVRILLFSNEDRRSRMI